MRALTIRRGLNYDDRMIAPAKTIPLRHALLIAGLWAFLGALLTLVTLDAARDVNWAWDGPGVTFDEGFNAEMGAYLVESNLRAGLGAIHPATQLEIHSSPAYNPDHPPLGRLAMGITNAVLQRISPQPDRLYVLTYARAASALEFGLLLGLISLFCQRHWGTIAANAAPLCLLLTPRVFGHAHLASLETAMNLTWTLAVLGLAERWAHRERLRWFHGIIPGLLVGLALLTKMQAVFLQPIFLIWSLSTWRWRAIPAQLTVMATAAILFFVAWPWLWSDPVGHWQQYFARSTERITLYCHYLGTRYADKAVPWHYPFVMFLITTPVVTLVLSGLGVTAKSADQPQRRIKRLVIIATLFPLVVFAIPKVSVYDGERLFLVVWPLAAVLAGIGAQHLAQLTFQPSATVAWRGRLKRWAVACGLLIGFASPIVSMVPLHPCQLSYYNELVGGLRGADALGFEPTYWGDAVTPAFLDATLQKLPPKARLGIAPVLHPATLAFWKRDSLLRLRPDIQLEAYDDRNPQHAKNVIVIRRHADPWQSLTPPPTGTEVEEQVTRSSVRLVEFLRLPE